MCLDSDPVPRAHGPRGPSRTPGPVVKVDPGPTGLLSLEEEIRARAQAEGWRARTQRGGCLRAQERRLRNRPQTLTLDPAFRARGGDLLLFEPPSPGHFVPADGSRAGTSGRPQLYRPGAQGAVGTGDVPRGKREKRALTGCARPSACLVPALGLAASYVQSTVLNPGGSNTAEAQARCPLSQHPFPAYTHRCLSGKSFPCFNT